MGRDGLSIRLENGAKLDRILSKMAVTKQSAASKIVNQSLNKGAAEVRKAVKRATPKALKDTTGFRTSSRNTTRGQLQRSVKSGLRKKVNVGRNVFMAGVWFQEGSGDNKDGFYAKWVINRHNENAFGYMGGNNFVTPTVRRTEGVVRRTIGTQLAQKIADFDQKQINKLR